MTNGTDTPSANTDAPAPQAPPPPAKNWLKSWEFAVVNLLLLILCFVVLQKPTGSIGGKIAMEQEGFDLYHYDMKGNSVYVMAVGPRGPSSDERGVWVNSDGSFRVDNLPVGEYSLKVHVPGFSTTWENGVFVEDGKLTNLKDAVLLSLSDPTINIATNRRVFSSQEKPSFWTTTSGSNKAEVKVYSKDMLSLLKKAAYKKENFELSTELSLWKSYDRKSEARPFAKLKPIKEFSRKVNGGEDNYDRQDYQLDQPLPPGDYFAVAECSNVRKKSDWAIIWFSVSDLGLIVKQDPEKTLVRAVDLKTLKPVANAQIDLLDSSANEYNKFAGAVTGADGFASISLPADRRKVDHQQILAFGTSGKNHAYGGISFYNNVNGDEQTYFYTDRPIYRLGQTVYFKGIVRKKEPLGFTNPGVEEVSVNIEDPDNNSLWNHDLKTNVHGTFNGAFDIPKDAKTGGYQVTISYPDGETQYERFEVGQYRKPEYQVEVTAIEPSVIAGGKAKAKIRAKYYFGAPVTNAKIDYSVYERPDYDLAYRLMYRPDYYSYFDGWDDENSDYYDSYYSGDFVTSGSAQTDENGEATVEFDTAATTMDLNDPSSYEFGIKKYKIEATVTDISRIAVESSGSLNAVPGDFALFVEPKNYVVKVGENINVSFNAVTYEKQPVKNQEIKLQLVRRKVDQDGHSKGYEVADEIRATTDDEGRGTGTFNAKAEYVTDQFYIVGRTRDKNGHDIMASRSIWLYDANDPWAISYDESSKQPLSLKLDKGAYLPGETAKIMVTAPISKDDQGAEAIIAIEGARIYSYKVIKLSAAAEMIEIPIKEDYAPNVYVTATFVGSKRQFYHQEKMLKVSPQNRFLDVQVSTDKARYKPGDKITYTIKAIKNDGKPAANTELSMGVVDESIYAVRADMTPDIKKYFYSKRENQVTTLCSFPEENSGGPDKIEPRVRKDFKDTAAWYPNLITDKDGIASTTFTLPDNLTTWRATVRGVDDATDVGWTINKVISTQDLLLRLALPRFFTQGDETFLTAVVHNYTDKPQTVNLTLTPSSQFQVSQGLVQKVEVKPDGATRYSWPVKVMTAGESLIRVKAVGQTAGDAMEMKVPVRSLGIPMVVSKGGFTQKEEDTITIPIPQADAAPGSATYKVCLSSSALSPIIGNYAALIEYPYGCTEQTMSKVMPSVVAMRLHQSLGAPLDKASIAKFGQVYKKGMEKLEGYQHSDGGWGWWENDDSQPYLTSLVLEGFYLLREAGYPVSAERAANGKKWLLENTISMKKQMADPKLVKTGFYWTLNERETDLARSAYTLSLYKAKLPADIMAYALSRRASYGPVPLAYWTMAAKQNGDNANAKLFYDQLMLLANDNTNGDSGRIVSFELTDAMRNKLAKRDWADWYDEYRYTGVETTALALRAAVAYDPADRDRIEAIKRWILMQRGKDGFGNTKTTSQVFIAMMNDELATKSAGEGSYKVEILRGQNPLGAFDLGKQARFEPERVLKADIDLNSTVKEVTIKKTGPGRLYYTAVLNYSRVVKPGQIVAEGQPKGLKVRREFFRLKATQDSDGKTHFRATPITDNRVKAGETLLMKVFVESPTRIPYQMTEVALPSGAEVVKNDSAEDKLEQEGDSHEIDTSSFWYSWWTHQDVLDDRISFFVTSMSSGKYEFHTMVRLELPGKYQLNPVMLEGMYTQGIRGYSNPDTITVTE